MWWYIGARFPVKVGGGTGASLRQLEKEAVKQIDKETIKAAGELVDQMAAKQGKVVVNLGGTGEVPNAINVNNRTAQAVKDIPNLVQADAAQTGSLFKPGSIDRIVSNDIVWGQVNWSKAAQGSFSALKSGGTISIAPYAGTLAEQLNEIKAALEAAGFKDVVIEAGRIVTGVKP